MPSYAYRCENCKAEVEIDRKISNSDTPPTTEEFPATEECNHSKEVIRIMKTSSWARGGNWRGSKGNWY